MPGRGHRTHVRRPQRPGRHLDRRPPQGKISQRGICHRTPRPSCRLYPLWLHAGARWVAGMERGRRGDMAPCAARRFGGHSRQHGACRLGRPRRHFHGNPRPLWQARRQPLRQRLAYRPGGLERLRRPGHAVAGAPRGCRRRRRHAAAGRAAGAGALDRRPLGRHHCARRGRPLGAAGRGLFARAGQLVAQLVGISTLWG